MKFTISQRILLYETRSHFFSWKFTGKSSKFKGKFKGKIQKGKIQGKTKGGIKKKDTFKGRGGIKEFKRILNFEIIQNSKKKRMKILQNTRGIFQKSKGTPNCTRIFVHNFINNKSIVTIFSTDLICFVKCANITKSVCLSHTNNTELNAVWIMNVYNCNYGVTHPLQWTFSTFLNVISFHRKQNKSIFAKILSLLLKIWTKVRCGCECDPAFLYKNYLSSRMFMILWVFFPATPPYMAVVLLWGMKYCNKVAFDFSAWLL